MGHPHIQNRIRAGAAVIICSAGISFAAGPAPAAGANGGSGEHAAAAPSAAAPAAQAAPSAPVQAAPHANPTTPAGAAPAAVHAVQPQQAPITPAAATNNGATRDHRHQDRNLQYQTNYGSFYLPDDQSYGEFGTIGNNGNENNASTFDNSAPAVETPAPAPVTPSQNPTSIAAQADNAVNRSPVMVTAGDEIQRVQAAVEADRQRVIAQLADKPDYQQALARKQNAAKNMSDVKPLGAGKPEAQVMDTASQKLDASNEVTKMQEAAIAADPQAAADKDRLARLVSERDAKAAELRK